MTTHPGRVLRQAMERGTVVAPGAFNALVARAVARAGFEACYISGGATANIASTARAFFEVMVTRDPSVRRKSNGPMTFSCNPRVL